MSARSLRWNDAVARLRWTSRVVWEELSWHEFLAMAALGFALGLFLWVNRPLHQEVRDLEASMVAAAAGPEAAAAESPVSRDRLEPGPQRSSAGFVAAFMAFLPAADVREQQLHTLHGLAGESGVELSRVEYGHANLEHLPGRRMTMQLTVRAEYAAYRKFLHNLLVAMPNLSIDRVTMELAPGQATEGAGALNVRIETSLYYRSMAAAGTP